MPEKNPPSPIDGPDVVVLIGLILLGVGLSFAISWPVALAVVGGILVLVGLLINMLPYLSRKAS